MVQVPVPKFRTVTIVPVGKATDEFGGTVKVFALATVIVTTRPASAKTKVYEAVCAVMDGVSGARDVSVG